MALVTWVLCGDFGYFEELSVDLTLRLDLTFIYWEYSVYSPASHFRGAFTYQRKTLR